MTTLATARLYLAKAREFLDAAEASQELELYNAATASAVVSGINSKDAICLALVGRSNKNDNHEAARSELKAAGPAGRTLEPVLGRLLRLKTRAEDQDTSVRPADAKKAVEWANRLYEGAQGAVRG